MAEKRDATAAAITAMEVANANARAAQRAAAEKMEEADRTVVEQHEVLESAFANIASLTRSLEAKTATIGELESALRAEVADEGGPRGWRLERWKVGGTEGRLVSMGRRQEGAYGIRA